MKKIVSLLLVVVLVATCFVGCAQTVEINCTCDCNKQAGGEASAAEAYSKLQAKSKSGVDCSKMPEDSAAILKLYNDVANATEAQKTQTLKVIDTGAKADISDVRLGKSGKPLSNSLMGTIKNLVKKLAPAESTTEYNFQNGKDANGNKDKDGNEKTIQNVLPVSSSDKMSLLKADDISEAKIEKIDADNYWKINIKVKDCKIEFKDPKVNPDTPQARFTGVMKSSDLIKSFGVAEVTYATIDYSDSTIQAIIDPASGYLVQLVIHMSYPMTVKGSMSVAGALEGTVSVDSTITYNWSSIG